MKSKSKHYKTGLFVLGGVVILFLFVFLLGARNLFQKKFYIETYFDESVHGLDIGSAVKYRGVAIGSVKEISFVHDNYKLAPDSPDFNKGRFVVVKMALKDVFGLSNKEMEPAVKKMIDDGLRVKIASQGLTGTSYLEIDFVNPERNPAMEIGWTPKEYYIPSSRSTFTKIGASIDELIKKIDKADIDTFVRNLDTLVLTLDKAVNDAKIPEVSSSTVLLLRDVQVTNAKLRDFIGSQGMQNFPSKLDEALTNMNKSMNKLNSLLSNNQSEIGQTVENLRAASEDFRELSGNMKKNSSFHLLGEAPTPVTAKK
ncbi:MAG: MlaD family protein [Leptospiraceae bacterium]|nr:MlaD family protein [Leptospiraceae bacterium]